MKKQHITSIVKYLLLAAYIIFIASSFIIDIPSGKKIAFNLYTFLLGMLKVLPPAFILIGLFEVWVKKESVEKHLGNDSSPLAYLWMILLAGTTVGGLYVAFPVAHSLFKKGARLSLIFTYIGASAICRIPMTIFEASFLGIKFTIIRLITSIPLILITAIILEKFLINKDYKITETK